MGLLLLYSPVFCILFPKFVGLMAQNYCPICRNSWLVTEKQPLIPAVDARKNQKQCLPEPNTLVVVKVRMTQRTIRIQSTVFRSFAVCVSLCVAPLFVISLVYCFSLYIYLPKSLQPVEPYSTICIAERNGFARLLWQLLHSLMCSFPRFCL